MSDLELLDLIHNKSPEELSVAEIEALRQGIAASPELRREVAERVEMEQYLHHALARVNVSVDDIISRAGVDADAPSGALAQLGLVAVAILGVAIGVFFVLAIVSPGWPEKKLATAHSSQTVKATAETAPIVKPQPAKEDEASGPSPSDLLPTEVVDNATGQPEQVVQAPEAPVIAEVHPWEEGDAESLPASNGEVFRTFDAGEPAPNADDLKRWFAPVDGQRAEFGTRDVSGGQWGLIEGLLRLKAPLRPNHALRLTIWDWSHVRIHAWAGNSGATIRLLGQSHNKPWVAYTTARSDSAPIPTKLVLAATDEDRYWRTNPNTPTTLQLRHHAGVLTLSHGDVRLLDIPMAIAPTEIYFDGSALIRELKSVPAVELPPLPSARPMTAEIVPARQPWTKPAEDTGTLVLNEDGSVELHAEKNSKAAISSTPIPRTGMVEFVCEVMRPLPGTGICLVDSSGKSEYLAAIAKNKQTGLLQLESANPGSPNLEADADPNSKIVTFLGDRFFLKLVLTSGLVRISTSVDGNHWVRADTPTRVDPVIAGIGMYASAHESARSLRLAKITLHEFDGVNQLAPAEVREKAVELADKQDLASFREAASTARPANVEPDVWLRACAIRSLAVNATATLGKDLIELLWKDSLKINLSYDQRLRLIEDLTTLAPTWHDGGLARQSAGRYEEFGRLLADQGTPSPYSQIAHPQMTAPIWSNGTFDFFPACLARRESLGLAQTRKWDDLHGLLRRLTFFRFDEKSKTENYFRWVTSLAEQQQPTPIGSSRSVFVADWRHPLTTELSKEGFNVLADLRVALESGAYRDACQVIGSANSSGMLGLLPDAEDPDLSVSLPATVALAMREQPQFRDTMAEEFGPLGRLRVRQSIAAGNAGAVEAATIQFYGTEAAAEAHLWLADRAISSGAFAAAQGHYRAARTTAPKAMLVRLAASEQLAAALMGRDASFKPQGTVELGDVRIQATEIAGLSDQLRAQRAAESAIGGASAADLEEVRLPSPEKTYEPVQRARLEGEAGQNPHGVPGEYQQKGLDWPESAVDWVAEQLHVRLLADRMLVSNRFQLASYDPKTAALQWRAGLGGDMASAHDWPLSPMRPLVTPQLAFVRRLRAGGPMLAAIDLSNGQPKWETRLDGEHWVVSDPALVGSTLYACTVRHTDVGYTLNLGAFDPFTGVMLRERELVSLRETWWRTRDCQMLTSDESFVITCGGAVLRCDLMGNLRWARKQLWIPPAVDTGWVLQSHEPPMLAEGRLIVVQPCVPGVVALDPDNGRLLWRSILPTARRVLGANDSQVFVATGDGVRAVDSATGNFLWHHQAELLDGVLVSRADGLLIATREPHENERCVALTWLDAKSGKSKGTSAFSTLKHAQPCFGPMFVQGDRLWAFFGKGLQDPTRDLIEFVPK